MTDVVVESVCTVRFECDTAASHSIMSEDVYNGLRKQKWRVPSMRQEELVVRLADGTVSSKACGSVRLKVRAKNTKEVELDFFVMDGPNNLLGRYALEKLWPSEYNALRRVATVSAAVLQQQQQQETSPIGIPGVGGPKSTVHSNEVHNSRRIPSVGEPKSGTIAANEVHNSSRSVRRTDNNSSIPSVGEPKSGTLATNEVHNSSRSARRADTNIIGTTICL